VCLIIISGNYINRNSNESFIVEAPSDPEKIISSLKQENNLILELIDIKNDKIVITLNDNYYSQFSLMLDTRNKKIVQCTVRLDKTNQDSLIYNFRNTSLTYMNSEQELEVSKQK
jgi:hypothetical protein